MTGEFDGRVVHYMRFDGQWVIKDTYYYGGDAYYDNTDDVFWEHPELEDFAVDQLPEGHMDRLYCVVDESLICKDCEVHLMEKDNSSVWFCPVCER